MATIDPSTAGPSAVCHHPRPQHSHPSSLSRSDTSINCPTPPATKPAHPTHTSHILPSSPNRLIQPPQSTRTVSSASTAPTNTSATAITNTTTISSTSPTLCPSTTSPTSFHYPSIHLSSFDSLTQLGSLTSHPSPSDSLVSSFTLTGSATAAASNANNNYNNNNNPIPNPKRLQSCASLHRRYASDSINSGQPQISTPVAARPASSASVNATAAHTAGSAQVLQVPRSTGISADASPHASTNLGFGSHSPAPRTVSPTSTPLWQTVGTESSSSPPCVPSITLGSLAIHSHISLPCFEDGPCLAPFTTPFKSDDGHDDDDKTCFDDLDDNTATTPPPPATIDRPTSWVPLVAPISGLQAAIPSLATLPDARSASPLQQTPTSSTFDLTSPRLRESPSVPRRTTIIEPGARHASSSPVNFERPLVPLSRQLSLTVSIEPEHGQETPGSSATPKRVVAIPALPCSPPPTSSTRPSQLNTSVFASETQLSRGTTTAVDSLALTVLASPIKKRSLPRPPKTTTEDSSAAATITASQSQSIDTIPMPTPMPVAVTAAAPIMRPPSFSIQTSPKANMAALGVVTGDPLPVGRSRPPQTKQQNRASTDQRANYAPAPMDQAQFKSSSMPAPFPASGHQPTNSASNLPAIAGLADAGPYPTTQLQMRQSSGGLGLPALPALPGAGLSGGLQIPQNIKPGEEICLECMMRDRDLANVDVTGDGVWERASDIALEELKSREYDLLRSMSIDHSVSMSTMSIDESISSSTHGETLSSPRSHASNLASDDATRKKSQGRDPRRQRRQDRDAQVARIGWRGFKWEEASGGDGFPPGFRGTRPGALTERGIKNVMTMFPSSSALRFQILQSYLRGQYRLIVEIRQEAHKLGQYPEPEELAYPPSPTLESHDSLLSGNIIAQRTVRVSMDRGASSIKAPSISTARSAPVTMQQPVPRLRESPSTPAGLNSAIKARPRTHYDREPTSAASRLSTATNIRPAPALGFGTSPSNRTSHLKAPSGSTGPKGRDSKFYAGDEWSDTEDLWPGYDELGSPASTNLRPFSFAVRAGQQREREGSVGSHHRRSIFGKFGDSVTSLFTGSHGGSGSMIDMHLGIDMDRRNQTSSYQVHESPRVSAFIPSRPSYSGRRSFLGPPNEDQITPPPVLQQQRPRAKSVTAAHHSTARPLTQVSMYVADDETSPKKKGGIKGLIQKMKKGGNKKDRRQSLSAAAAADDNSAQELVPPPPMNFLVNRGESSHDRKRSSSSISMANDSQASLAPASQAQRSVSAPMGSSGSDISPTSSRFQPDSKAADLPRRSTGPAAELPPGAAEAGYNVRRGSLMGSTMEMLTGPSHNGAAQPVAPNPDVPVVFDEPQPLRETMLPNGPALAPTYPNKGSLQTSLSSRYSASSTTMQAIETPESMNTMNSYLSPAQQVNTSPNRYKNLPPLPPGMILSQGSPSMGSPEMYSDPDALSMRGSMYDNKRMSSMPFPPPRASMSVEPPTNYRTGVPPSSDYFPTASPRYHPPLLANQSGPILSGSPSQKSVRSSNSTPFPQSGGGFVPQQRVIQPRASFDVLADSRSARVRRSTAVPGNGMPMDSGRNAQSMYIQQSAAASTGSFGRFLKGDPRVSGGPPPLHVANMVASSVAPAEDRKERRRGIKSIFGKK